MNAPAHGKGHTRKNGGREKDDFYPTPPTRYVGRLTKSTEGVTGHLVDPADEQYRVVLAAAGKTLTATLPGGAHPWRGEVVLEGDTLRALLWHPDGTGFDVTGTRDAEGYALAAEGAYGVGARIPLIDGVEAA